MVPFHMLFSVISPKSFQIDLNQQVKLKGIKIIANRAYKMFIKGDLTALSDGDSTDTEIIQEV